jgi:mandelate racemase
MTPETLTFHSVDVRAVVLKLRRPVVAKIATITDWPLILIDLKTEEGVVGRSYLEPYIVKSMNYLVPALRDMGAMLEGQRLAPAEVYETARKSLHFVGYEGMSMIAVSGIDLAAWDTLARAAGMPLCTLLGGSPGPVRAYNSNGLGLMEPDAVAAQAVELLEGGFRAMKIRFGRDHADGDLAAFEAVRAAIPEDCLLMSDFNQGLSRREALRRLPMLDDLGLVWFEEPVAYDDYDGCRELRETVATPIQIGENFYGPADLQAAVAADAADFVMPDAQRIGGVTGWLRAAAVAHGAQLPVSTHLFPEVSSHLMRVTPGAHWLEYVDWATPFLAEPLQVQDGYAQVTTSPGTGIEWDEDAVRKLAA